MSFETFLGSFGHYDAGCQKEGLSVRMGSNVPSYDVEFKDGLWQWKTKEPPTSKHNPSNPTPSTKNNLNSIYYKKKKMIDMQRQILIRVLSMISLHSRKAPILMKMTLTIGSGFPRRIANIP